MSVGMWVLMEAQVGRGEMSDMELSRKLQLGWLIPSEVRGHIELL